jgi:GLPGLI family protein
MTAFFALSGLAQEISGEVFFTETIRLTIDLPEDLKDLGIQIPSEQTRQKQLLFSPAESLYLNAKDSISPDQEIGAEGGDFHFTMKVTESDERFHYDLEKGKTLELREFMDKKFLIKGTSDSFQWKLTGEQKKVAGYVCQQAIHEVDSQQIIAWFSPQLPLSVGPAKLTGLPGMILEAEMDEVNLRPLGKAEIELPKGGKFVSEEKFEQIVEEKTKELQMEMSGSGSGSGSVIRVIRQ